MRPSLSAQSRHDRLLAQGRAALLAGDKPQAQALLKAAVKLDPASEDGWMWLSGTYAEPAEMARCLQRVLLLNPAHVQAQEGLDWITAEYGALAPPTAPPVSAAEATAEIHFQPAPDLSIGALVEAALHPFAAGAFLGLLRLVAWLRPATLAIVRSERGQLSLGAAAGGAAATALLHGLALLLVWYTCGTLLSRSRLIARGDRFDSLVRAGRLWLPGYLWALALLVAGAGLGLSPRPWRVVAVLCWALLIAGAALIGRRLAAMLRAVGLPEAQRAVQAGRIVVTLILGSVITLGLAGIAARALLR
jgi:hypothetical protein